MRFMQVLHTKKQKLTLTTFLVINRISQQLPILKTALAV